MGGRGSSFRTQEHPLKSLQCHNSHSVLLQVFQQHKTDIRKLVPRQTTSVPRHWKLKTTCLCKSKQVTFHLLPSSHVKKKSIKNTVLAREKIQ